MAAPRENIHISTANHESPPITDPEKDLDTPTSPYSERGKDAKDIESGEPPPHELTQEIPSKEHHTGPAITNILTRSSTNPEARPSCFKTTTQEILCVLTAAFATAESSILVGATAGLTSHIAADLAMTQSQVTWITASSSLAAGTFLMFFGSIADTFGRRPMLLISMLLFAIFSLVAGFANNPIYMDVLCALLGLCSAASVPPAIGIIGAAYKHQSKRKNMAFAIYSAGNPLGFVVGCFISGVSFQVSTWRTSFWVLAVLYGILSVAAYFSVPLDEIARASFTWETLKKFDYVGVILVSSGLALFTASLSYVIYLRVGLFHLIILTLS